MSVSFASPPATSFASPAVPAGSAEFDDDVGVTTTPSVPPAAGVDEVPERAEGELVPVRDSPEPGLQSPSLRSLVANSATRSAPLAQQRQPDASRPPMTTDWARRRAQLRRRSAAAAAASATSAPAPAPPKYARELAMCRDLLAYLDAHPALSSRVTPPPPTTSTTTLPDPNMPPPPLLPTVPVPTPPASPEHAIPMTAARRRTISAPASAAVLPSAARGIVFKFPLHVMEAFWALAVPVPVTVAEAPTTRDAVQARMRWYEQKVESEGEGAGVSLPSPSVE
ncbi:hypothetical protein AMAG_15134 [Allomyces macrogynus ATCC 38327]|uniref:Uncharacterized protein n=1 Tax=Allomyces macrogynus (strain ATCC 38327) TaxID=578462 RepID=A0A0L0T645_ALLM3|nr:hypothetical protein AMAG_15134 [Allomyces macrogynus ATCC 38327]|eukprot:KNE70161.1 hypothetical protein AMAG_15134 [Allomyces macrogynus ATCC 38327]